MIAPGELGMSVHALLNDGPFPALGENESMQVNLEAVGDGVVVDTSGETAGAYEFRAIETGAVGVKQQLVRSSARLFAAATANIDAEFVSARIQPAFERGHDGRGDAGGVPVHAHDAAERLEPEGIAESR